MPSQNVTLAGSAARTANGAGSAIAGLGDTSSLRAQLDVTAVSGTAPSMTVVIQDTLDGVNWNTIGTFAGVTAIGREVINITTPYAGQIRASWTITGTTPSFTFSVMAHGT